MEISAIERRELDYQADQIERALLDLSLSVQVARGKISPDRICYQLGPLAEPIASQVVEVSTTLAEAIGVPELRILREAEGIAIDVPQASDIGLRLLPLQDAVGALPPMTALLGLAEDHRPFVQTFSSPSSWHLLIQGPQGCGKSEALRTVLMSIGLNNHPVEMHFAGIDIAGRELAILDAVPHTVTDVASDLESAENLLVIIAQEVETRIRFEVIEPGLILWIDELDELLKSGAPSASRMLESILKNGRAAGVHVFAGQRVHPNQTALGGLFQQRAVQVVSSSSAMGQVVPGFFDVHSSASQRSERVEMAWLPVSDLDQVVGEIQSAWNDGFYEGLTIPVD